MGRLGSDPLNCPPLNDGRATGTSALRRSAHDGRARVGQGDTNSNTWTDNLHTEALCACQRGNKRLLTDREKPARPRGEAGVAAGELSSVRR
jgi:hypothetical protein